MEDEGNNVDFPHFHGSSYQLWRQMWVHDIIKKTVNVNVSASKSAVFFEKLGDFQLKPLRAAEEHSFLL